MSKEETMVEMAGRAVQAKISELTSDTDTFEYVCGTGRLASEEIALAVIDALMEPTPEMTQAALRVPEVKDVDWVNALFGTGIGSYQQIFEASYRAMLSKAKEGTGE